VVFKAYKTYLKYKTGIKPRMRDCLVDQ